MRSVLGVVAGWVTLALLVAAGFVLGPWLLGLERVFVPGEYRATPLWVYLAMGIGFVGALAGGYVATRIGRGRGPVAVLLLVVLGSTAVSELTREAPSEAPPARPATESTLEALRAAQEHGEEPLLTRITNPLVGVLGLLLGARLARRSGAQAPTGKGAGRTPSA